MMLAGVVMHALVVDDNKSFCDNIGSFILSHIPRVKQVTVAFDGFEALDLLASIPVDIVLADVRMPRLDGIELATIVRRRFPFVKIVFLSAYDDSQYLKQAIRLKAFDYLLKPVDYDELVVILNQVIDRIENDRLNEQKISQIDRLTIQRILRTRIEGKHSGESSQDETISLQFPRYSLILLRYPQDLDFAALLDKYPLRQNQWFIPYQTGLAYLVVAHDDQSEQSILHDAGRFVEYFRVKYNTMVQAVISCSVQSLNELSTARVQTDKLAELGYFMQSQSLISKIDLPHQHQFIDWMSIRNHVQILLTNNNPTDLTKFVRELNQLIYKYEHYDRISTEMLYINIVQESVHHLRELGKYVDSYFDTDLAITKYVQDCLYYSDLHQMTLSILLRWSQSVIAPDDENETIIKAFIAYIDQNFANNITLDSLSSHLFISRSTLCMLIKNKLGQTVNEYINERRLMQGRDFLMNTDMSITDIAMRSGFSDANYFIKRYKKQYGLTPQVDRMRLRRSEPYEC